MIIAEPVRFFIDLPEHFGLESYSNPNTLENTRTIKGSWLSTWYTNYNNLHTAHHFNYAVPMINIPKLYPIIKEHVSSRAMNDNYMQFYLKLIRGEIRPAPKPVHLFEARKNDPAHFW